MGTSPDCERRLYIADDEMPRVTAAETGVTTGGRHGRAPIRRPDQAGQADCTKLARGLRDVDQRFTR